VTRGCTPAEELLAQYHGTWRGSVEPVFVEYAY
jgi:glutamate--cysteine ligase